MKESNQDKRIMLGVADLGARLFRNIRGSFYPPDSMQKIMKFLSAGNVKQAMNMIRRSRRIAAGINVRGSSDLIGYLPVTITEDMVGKKVAVFVAMEDKMESRKPTRDQVMFVNAVKSNGGIGAVVYGVDDARMEIEKFLNNLVE